MDGVDKQILHRKRFLLEENRELFTESFLLAAVSQGLVTPQQMESLRKEDLCSCSQEELSTTLLDVLGNGNSSLDKVVYLLQRHNVHHVADELLAEKAAMTGELVIDDRIIKETENIVTAMTEHTLLGGNPANRLITGPSGRTSIKTDKTVVDNYVERLIQVFSSKIQVGMETMKRQINRKRAIMEEEHKVLRNDMFALCKFVKDYLLNFMDDLGDKDFDFEENLTETNSPDFLTFVDSTEDALYREIIENDRKILTLLHSRVQSLMSKLDEINSKQDDYHSERIRCFMLLGMEAEGRLDESLSHYLSKRGEEFQRTQSELKGKSDKAHNINLEFRIHKREVGMQLAEQQRKVDYLIARNKEVQRNVINYQSALRNAREAETKAKDDMYQMMEKVGVVEKALRMGYVKDMEEDSGSAENGIENGKPSDKVSNTSLYIAKLINSAMQNKSSTKFRKHNMDSSRQGLNERSMSAKQFVRTNSRDSFNSLSRPTTAASWRSDSRADSGIHSSDGRMSQLSAASSQHRLRHTPIQRSSLKSAHSSKPNATVTFINL